MKWDKMMKPKEMDKNHQHMTNPKKMTMLKDMGKHRKASNSNASN